MTEGKAARSAESRHKIARRFAARRLPSTAYLFGSPLDDYETSFGIFCLAIAMSGA